MEIVLSKEKINVIDLSELFQYADWHPNVKFFKSEESEHYKLLSYLSKYFANELFVDIGTFYGFSALALSHNELNNIMSYDIKDWIITDSPKTAKTKENITCIIKDCNNDIDIISKAKIIMLDIDPHDSIEERNIIANLRKNNFKGLLVLDDIKRNQNMKNFWETFITEEKKYDISEIAHWSGTGIVNFSDDIIIKIE